jgi:uncharacterized protein
MTGRFVWHEYMATDMRAAIAFYGEVIGWTTERFPDSPAPSEYTMWVSRQGPLGGLMQLPEVARTLGAPPQWMGYVEVDDIDATVAKVEALGGTVRIPPTEIPTVGRFSVISDPQGATLSVLQPAPMETEPPPRDKHQHGEFLWNELHAADGPAALAFYRELFGWAQTDELDMGPAGKYHVFGQGDELYGGVMTRTGDLPRRPSWLHYVGVEDLDAALARATSRGARILHGPAPVPGGGRMAQLTDPQGGLFALHGAA